LKVAIVTNNGQTVSQHFGRSRYYFIVTIKDEKVVDQEYRERGVGHFASGGTHEHHHDHGAEHDHDHEAGHGYGAEAGHRHSAMAREISDCDMLVAGGMGRGAYDSFKAAGLEVVLTDYQQIDEVIGALLSGTLENKYEERTH